MDETTRTDEQVQEQDEFEFDYNSPLWEDVERGVKVGNTPVSPLIFSFGAVAREVRATVQTVNDLLDCERVDESLKGLGAITADFDISDTVLVLTGLNVLGCFIGTGQVQARLREVALRLRDQNKAATEAISDEDHERGEAAAQQVTKERMANAIGIPVEEMEKQVEAAKAAMIDGEITPDGEEGPTLH